MISIGPKGNVEFRHFTDKFLGADLLLWFRFWYKTMEKAVMKISKYDTTVGKIEFCLRNKLYFTTKHIFWDIYAKLD